MTDVLGGSEISGVSSAVLRGGDVHIRTILESCRIAVDEIDGKSMHQSAHYDTFMQALAASVNHDRMVTSPESLGYNGDPRMRGRRYGSAGTHGYDEHITTYNGQTY